MHGNELLETIGSLNTNGASAAIMRHAARFPIVDPAKPTLAEITPEGAASAEAMGRRITGFDQVRLFHSPVTRCRQTAECIARGVEKAGLEVELAGPQNALGVDYILDLAEAGRLSILHGDHFVRLWVEAQFARDVILPTKDIAETKLTYLVGKLIEPSHSGRRLDLHVSHDWNVLVLRELMLGVRHEEAGWLNYLDGIAFSIGAAQLQAVYRNQARTQTLPWRF